MKSDISVMNKYLRRVSHHLISSPDTKLNLVNSLRNEIIDTYGDPSGLTYVNLEKDFGTAKSVASQLQESVDQTEYEQFKKKKDKKKILTFAIIAIVLILVIAILYVYVNYLQNHRTIIAQDVITVYSDSVIQHHD